MIVTLNCPSFPKHDTVSSIVIVPVIAVGSVIVNEAQTITLDGDSFAQIVCGPGINPEKIPVLFVKAMPPSIS